jgi:RHS repeat-associated protein
MTASTSTTTTDSAWDTVSGGSIPLNINDQATTSSATTNTSYLYGDLLFGGTAPLEQITTTSSSATPVFLVPNPTGVQEVVSTAGADDELAVYSVYGKQTISSGSHVTPFGFQGSYTDATGLVYLVNRYYDPTTDQFLSIDPDVATTDQPYVFTNDDPLNAEDPEGLSDLGDADEGFADVFNASSLFNYDFGDTSGISGGSIGTPLVDLSGAGAAGSGEASSIPEQVERGSVTASDGNIPGLSSNYEDITSKSSIRNVSTNVTPQQFGDNLKETGWQESTSQSGRATIYTKDGAKYSVYPVSGSTGGPTAEFTPPGSPDATLKIRLGR